MEIRQGFCIKVLTGEAEAKEKNTQDFKGTPQFTASSTFPKEFGVLAGSWVTRASEVTFRSEIIIGFKLTQTHSLLPDSLYGLTWGSEVVMRNKRLVSDAPQMVDGRLQHAGLPTDDPFHTSWSSSDV